MMPEPGGARGGNGDGEKRPADRARHDHVAMLALIAIVIALLVAFTLGNSEQVKVSFVFFHVRSSLIWVLLATNLLGFVAGYLLHGRLQDRRARKPKQGR